MNVPQWNKRFLSSTRGRIISLLRGSTQTVAELAEDLDLTGNAVRAHLMTLERDGLVHQSGLLPGTRKPHYAYELTAEAEALFPKPYETVLDQLLATLEERLPEEKTEFFLREVGQRVASRHRVSADASLDQRIEAIIEVFHDLGGLAEVERKEDHILIRGKSCPMGTTAIQHPRICKMAESLVEEVVGAPAQECCDRQGDAPSCCFEVQLENNPSDRSL